MAGRSPPLLLPTAVYRTVLFLWLLEGLVSGFFVGTLRVSLPRAKHVAQHGSADFDQRGGAAAAAVSMPVLVGQGRCNAGGGALAAARDVTPEEEVGSKCSG